MSCTTSAPGLSCLPAAVAPAERQAHFELARKLFHERAVERIRLPNGYAIRFPPDALQAVAKFVANERKCCPFVSFELALSAESGSLWLRMTGPEGTREVLDRELNLDRCECG